jgi:hypothetical protein
LSSMFDSSLISLVSFLVATCVPSLCSIES